MLMRANSDSKFLGTLVALSLSTLLFGCFGSRIYGELALPDGHLAAHAREHLLGLLPEKIRASGAARIEVTFPGNTLRVFDRTAGAPEAPPELTEVPTPALAALYIGLL